MSNDSIRKAELERRHASEATTQELLQYNSNHFHAEPSSPLKTVPMLDEPCIDAWTEYVEEVVEGSTLNVLRKYIGQLNFPIKEGISTSDEYRRVTLKGESPEGLSSATGTEVLEPDQLRVELFHSAAGHIPVVTTSCRADFVTLIQAITLKNEPTLVPDSQGASMIAGYPNWDRIWRYRKCWEAKNPSGFWSVEFKNLTKNKKSLFQDRLIILSDGDYSAVSAEDIGLPHQQWQELSWQIRLAHECAHYFTRRAFNSMQNRLLDEIIADCAGIVAANRSYRSDWFLRFMGFENYPEYRSGGRFENYKGEPALSDEAFLLLQQLVVDASMNIESFLAEQTTDFSTPAGQALLISGLSLLTIEEMAAPSSKETFSQAFDTVHSWPGFAKV